MVLAPITIEVNQLPIICLYVNYSTILEENQILHNYYQIPNLVFTSVFNVASKVKPGYYYYCRHIT